MPVTVGSRLERLLDLDRRVKLAIEEERRRELSGAGGRLPEPLVMRQEVLPRPRDDDDGSMWGTREKRACLVRCRATTADVRSWAVENGHPAGKAGPLLGTVLRAYELAHTIPV